MTKKIIQVLTTAGLLACMAFNQGAMAASSNPGDWFGIKVKTDNAGSSTNLQFTIPTTGSGYDYDVDCAGYR